MDVNNTESKNSVTVSFSDAIRGMFSWRTKAAKAARRLKTADLTRVDLMEMLVELGWENVRLKEDLEDRNLEIEQLKLLLAAARKAVRQEQES